MVDRATRDTDIAVIAMTGRFPQAGSVGSLWEKLAAGADCFSDLDGAESGSAVWEVYAQHPGYVSRRPILDDIKGFDAGLFGFSPREASLTDPQQRVFLECVHELLEIGGYGSAQLRPSVGLFGGTNIGSYLQHMMEIDLPALMEIDDFELMIGNDKDSLTTMASYRLDLTGPAVTVQTYCSTSAVATHLAIQCLRNGEADMAVAGGVCIRVPDKVGYIYVEGGQASPDGYVRTFDAEAGGSVFGDGCAMVLLKPLRKALADRDNVLAVILGSGMNNDGASKFSYTAPSVDGQAGAVAAALRDADVDPRDVSYVEAHGTATILGDPIEVSALTRAYDTVARQRSGRALGDRQFCAIGSVKTNVGHLDRAATVTGMIKVIESLRHEVIPQNLNFHTPNPEINFPQTPFYVADRQVSWPRQTGSPRVAGVNGLGMGGTNVHLVLTEAPDGESRPRTSERRWHLLPVSARTEAAADQYAAALAEHLAASEADIADEAFTLQVGRAQHAHRRVVVADSHDSAAAALTGRPVDGAAALARHDGVRQRRQAFLLAGVGEHYAGMVGDLYRTEPAFRRHLDEVQRHLAEFNGLDVVGPLTAPRAPASGGGDLAALMGRAPNATAGPMAGTGLAQPAVFAAEYALARTLMSWGLAPDVLLGYSVGEYVAAAVAGTLSLRDATRLVAYRASLIDDLPGGAMLAVGLEPDAIESRIGDLRGRAVDVAAHTPGQVVLGGPADAVRAVAGELRALGVPCREIETTHAFHTRMLEPAADTLTRWAVENVEQREPMLPYLSNVTGEPITPAEATDPSYWARHMTSPVQFSRALEHLFRMSNGALVEIGPGRTLGAMVRSHPACDRSRWPMLVATLPGADEPETSDRTLTGALAELWLLGVDVTWTDYHNQDGAWQPGRVPMPTYPYQRQEYWFRGSGGATAAGDDLEALYAEYETLPLLPEHEWLFANTWRERLRRRPMADPGARWVVFVDDASEPVVDALRDRLSSGEVVLVRPGDRFEHDGDYRVRPGRIDDLQRLFAQIRRDGGVPDRVVHLWSLDDTDVAETVRRGMHTLVGVARSALEVGFGTWALDVVTSGTFRLHDEPLSPATATVHGPCTILPVEDPGGRIRVVDLVRGEALPVDAVVDELLTDPANQVIALRDGRRWAPDFETVELAEEDLAQPADRTASRFREGGTYLITGGLGGIGMAMAERIVTHHRGRVVLMGRTSVPDRRFWREILDSPATSGEVRRRIEGLVHLEDLGGEVLTVAGDVAVVADVQRAFDLARERFGAVHGVLHAAGVPGMGMMQFKNSPDMDAVLAPKVAGTLAIAEVVGEDPLDFLVLFSSVASWTGALGQADYSSANAFLDTFARSGALPQAVVVAIGWGEWTWNGWEEGLEGYEPVLREYYTEHRRQFGIDFDTGWRYLELLLERDEPHLLVSTQDFAAQAAGSRSYSITDIQTGAQRGRGSERYPRPELSTPYVSPSSETEIAIAEIWGEWLGVAEVGVMDNFFDLGGNSLTGVGVIEAIRKQLQLEHLPAHTLYQSPTVSTLAAHVAPAAEPERAASEPDDRVRQRQQRLASRRPARSGNHDD